MSKRVGAPFCTNVLRVALNFKEEMVASSLVANYNVQLDKRMIVRALKTNQLNFLYCVWAFNKNYEIKAGLDLDDFDIAESESDEEELLKQTPGQVKERATTLEKVYRTYTFDFLIKQVLEYCTEEYVPIIR